MDFLENRFKSLDSTLEHVKRALVSTYDAIEVKIERVFLDDELFNRINAKRGVQLNLLEKKLRTVINNINILIKKPESFKKQPCFQNLFFNKLHRSYYKKQLNYLKSKSNVDDLTTNLTRLHYFGRVRLQNEFNIYKKFYYFHLYQTDIKRRECPTEYKGYQYECCFLSKESYLIQDLEKKELILLDKKGYVVKKVSIKSSYSVNLFKIINSKIIVILYNAKTRSKYICILDFDLNVQKTRKLESSQLLINFGPDSIFFQQCSSVKNNRFLVLDLDLNEVESIDANLFQEKHFIDTNRTHLFNVVNDRVLIKDFLDSNFYNIKIVSKTNGDLIQTINNLNYFINRINYFVKIDSDLNIYIINTCKEDNLAYLYCYNLNGQLIFKRFVPFLGECYYVDFVSEHLVSFNYMNEVDLF